MLTSTIPPESLLDPVLLLNRIRSGHVSLSKRLRMLAQLANCLDDYLSHVPHQPLAMGDEALPQQVGAQLSSSALPPSALPQSSLNASEASRLLDAAYAMVQSQILPRLRRRHLCVTTPEELSDAQQQWLKCYFDQRIYPMLTPLAVDPARPFPYIVPGSLYLLVTLQAVGQYCRLVNGMGQTPYPAIDPANPANSPNGEREIYALIQLCSVGPRLVQVAPVDTPSATVPTLLWREDIVRYFINTLFPQMVVTGVYQFRLLRAAEVLTLQPHSLYHAIDSTRVDRTFDQLRSQQSQIPVVHIDVEQGTPPHLIQWLTTHLHTSPACVLSCPPPLGIADLSKLADYL